MKSSPRPPSQPPRMGIEPVPKICFSTAWVKRNERAEQGRRGGLSSSPGYEEMRKRLIPISLALKNRRRISTVRATKLLEVHPCWSAEPAWSTGKCQAAEQCWLTTGQVVDVAGAPLIPFVRSVLGAAARGQPELTGLGAQGLSGNAQHAGGLGLVAPSMAKDQPQK